MDLETSVVNVVILLLYQWLTKMYYLLLVN